VFPRSKDTHIKGLKDVGEVRREVPKLNIVLMGLDYEVFEVVRFVPIKEENLPRLIRASSRVLN